MPGAFRTSAELVTKVLANLGVLAVGQSIDPEDAAAIQSEIDPLLRKLNALEIVNVPDPDNIPGAFFSDLADILAGECATKFGANPDHYTVLIQRGLGAPPGAGVAALSLKQITRGRPTYEILQTDYL